MKTAWSPEVLLTTFAIVGCTLSNVKAPFGVELVAKSSPVPLLPVYCITSTYFFVAALYAAPRRPTHPVAPIDDAVSASPSNFQLTRSVDE